MVSLPELVRSLLSIDSKRLGYWGAETKVFADPKNELPGLVTAELKKQIERVASLKGKEKEVRLRSIQTQLDKRIQLRKAYAGEKLKSVPIKLERLTELSARMSKQDVERVAKLLQGTPPPSQDNAEDDPFK